MTLRKDSQCLQLKPVEETLQILQIYKCLNWTAHYAFANENPVYYVYKFNASSVFYNLVKWVRDHETSNQQNDHKFRTTMKTEYY